MKKLFIVLFAVVAIAAACNNQVSVQPTPTPTETPTPSPTPTETQPKMQTYTNATYGFSFDYPVSMNFVTPNYGNLQDKVTSVQIPRSTYLNTNFGDADFTVSAQFAKDIAACLKLSPPTNNDGFKPRNAVTGIDFYVTKSSDTGAGNIYSSTVYRTMEAPNGACIEIDETIHTSNIGNYPAGTVTEVDSAAVQAQLDAILNSFRFNITL